MADRLLVVCPKADVEFLNSNLNSHPRLRVWEKIFATDAEIALTEIQKGIQFGALICGTIVPRTPDAEPTREGRIMVYEAADALIPDTPVFFHAESGVSKIEVVIGMLVGYLEDPDQFISITIDKPDQLQ